MKKISFFTKSNKKPMQKIDYICTTYENGKQRVMSVEDGIIPAIGSFISIENYAGEVRRYKVENLHYVYYYPHNGEFDVGVYLSLLGND